MANLTLPDKLREMSLGQLVALGEYIEYGQSEEKDTEQLVAAIASMFNLSLDQVRGLSGTDYAKIFQAFNAIVEPIVDEYIELSTTKSGTNYFTCVTKPWHQIKALENAAELNKKNGFWRGRAKGAKKKSHFYIDEQLGNEPGAIWLKLLDNYVRRIEANKHVWKDWALIPQVLAHIAWRKGENRFTKNLQGELVVDWEGIAHRMEIFLQADATEAIRAWNFFLSIAKLSLGNRYITQFLGISNQDLSKYPRKESNSKPVGDGKVL